MRSAGKRGRPRSQKVALEIARDVSARKMVAEAAMIKQSQAAQRPRSARLPPPVATKVYSGGVFVSTVGPNQRIKVLMKAIYRDVAEKFGVHADYVRRCYARHRPAVIARVSNVLNQRAAVRDDARKQKRQIETIRWLAKHGVRIVRDDADK